MWRSFPKSASEPSNFRKIAEPFPVEMAWVGKGTFCKQAQKSLGRRAALFFSIREAHVTSHEI